MSNNIKERILTPFFRYQKLKSSKVKDLYYLLVIDNALNDVVESIFSKMESNDFKVINENILARIADRVSKFTFSPDSILKKTSINKLFLMLETEFVKNNEYMKNAVIRVLCQWIPRLKANSDELNKLLLEFSEYSIYQVSKQQVRETDDLILLKLNDMLEDNKPLLAELVIKIGQDKLNSMVKTRIENKLKDDPNNFDNQYNSAVSNLNLKNYDEAIKGFKKAISINPESHLANYLLAYCYEEKGQYEIAISYYKKAAQLKYNYIDAYYNLGMIYAKTKDNFLANQQFKKILKIEPDHYDACVALGVSYDEMGELDQAYEYYEKAIKIDPEKPDAYINKAIILTLKGKDEEAIQNYNLAAERSHGNSKIQFNLGVIYHQRGDYSGAIAYYKLAIKFDKNNSMAYNNLGLAYFSKVRVNDAIECWEKAISIDPKNIDAYNNLGWAYNVIGEMEKSITTYEKAKTIEPKHSILYMNLGTVYYKDNQIEKAIKELEKFLEVDPNSDKAFEIIKILKSLRNQLKVRQASQ
ncbi:MAG: tetratricopeptide repeat protein [Candidatus Sericytochromatia bacterium]